MRIACFRSSGEGLPTPAPLMQTQRVCPPPFRPPPDPLDADLIVGRPLLPYVDPSWMQTSSVGRPPPSVDRQTPVKTLPCPKPRLRAVINRSPLF